MPLDVAETKEEQQIGVGKARVWRQGKKIEFVLILFGWISSIGRDPLYLEGGMVLTH